MTDRALFREIFKALGGIKDGEGSSGLEGQLNSIKEIRRKLKVLQQDVSNQLRVANAEETREQRLKPGDRSYGVHMRHCYGLDYDSVYGDEAPTERYSCKYGEDDICPAALFEDPWAEYERAEDAGEF